MSAGPGIDGADQAGLGYAQFVVQGGDSRDGQRSIFSGHDRHAGSSVRGVRRINRSTSAGLLPGLRYSRQFTSPALERDSPSSLNAASARSP